jgi:hypothetical protein
MPPPHCPSPRILGPTHGRLIAVGLNIPTRKMFAGEGGGLNRLVAGPTRARRDDERAMDEFEECAYSFNVLSQMQRYFAV